jgi:hypothetical protein
MCALPLLLLGALLLALPARSAAGDPARERLADSVHVLKNAVPEPSAEENEDMQVARELERVLKELQQATEQLESLKHRDQAHQPPHRRFRQRRAAVRRLRAGPERRIRIW